ncbi:MAG: hypothetical protein IH934_04775 [Nanoarchaeota archaeon]|nr:hypothetical protein [Nanoarchaeota archaeon]
MEIINIVEYIAIILIIVIVGMFVILPSLNGILFNHRFCENRGMEYSYHQGNRVTCILVVDYKIIKTENFYIEKTLFGNVK